MASPHALAEGVGGTGEQGAAGRPQVLELRRYRLRNGAMATRFAAYAKDALVPALGRAGLSPIGAWNVSVGPDSPTVHLRGPHPGAEPAVTLAARVYSGREYVEYHPAFGVLILAGYLRGKYAQDKPLTLTASLAFDRHVQPAGRAKREHAGE